jgi:hypothetical protein
MTTNSAFPALGAPMSLAWVCRSITAMVRPCQGSSKVAISAPKSGHRVDVGLASSQLAHRDTKGGFLMRTYALAIAAVAALFFPVAASSQNIEIGPGGVHIGRDRDREGSRQQDCEELRSACLHKEELGEEGEGNCRRYRENCKE